MSTTTIYKHGDPTMVDYVPAADVAVGDVIVVGDTVRMAHRAYKTGEKGALSVGGGVYQFPKAAGAGSGIADGKKVYWDATNKVITATAGSNKTLGYTVGTSADADTTQLVFHHPY
ncbi:MAG: DUF2190 family protein [Phycisphaerae bacterium]